jgi:hypothetical protein
VASILAAYGVHDIIVFSDAAHNPAVADILCAVTDVLAAVAGIPAIAGVTAIAVLQHS